MTEASERGRLVAAAAAYLDHREKYGHLPATDEPNPTFNEFMVALIRVCPDGWADAGKLARLIVLVGGADRWPGLPRGCDRNSWCVLPDRHDGGCLPAGAE